MQATILNLLLGVAVFLCLIACSDDFLTDDVVLGFNPEASSSSSSSSSDDGTTTEPEDDDADGLSNEVEDTFLMDSVTADSDFDGIADGLEFVVNSGDPLDSTRSPNPLNNSIFLSLSDAVQNDLDRDEDGLGDTFEENNDLDPLDADTDNDGYQDGLELIAQSSPTDSNSRPSRAAAPMDDGLTHSGQPPQDSDRDGLADTFESLNGTLINSRDSDSDGFSDGIEYIMGSDGTDFRSIPNF